PTPSTAGPAAVRTRSGPGRALGIVVVAACAVVASATGEARGFFLLPAIFPVAVVGTCLISIAVGRPLTGLLLNGLIGGPADWYRDRGLRRVHLIATWAAIGINTVTPPCRPCSRPGTSPPCSPSPTSRPDRPSPRSSP
ncbi:MAG: DUF3159 domain-containing protein, partial [Pseudonocardia sp.]